MPEFQYRVEKIQLDQPSGEGMILRYEKQVHTGTTLHSIDELGKAEWELVYLEHLNQRDFFAVFKREVS